MSRPFRKPRDELRTEILDAARRILLAEGADGLTARALAREVGYTAASIYQLFNSMSDVLMEVNRETFTHLAALFEDLPAEEAPAQKLHRVCASYIGFMQANPALWSALFGGMRERSSFPDWYGEAIAGLMGRLTSLLIAHAPQLSVAEARRLTEQLYVAVHGAVALALERRLDLVTEQSAHEIGASVLDAMLSRLQPAPREAVLAIR